MTNNALITPLTPELYCSNIKTSLVFYTEVLGFEIQYQREEEGFAMLRRQGARIMLDELSDAGQKRIWLEAPLEKPFGRGINFEIRTTQINALYAHVQQCGANILMSIEDKCYRMDDTELHNRQFIVLDPDGYLLRFTQTLSSNQLNNSREST
jgi:catechol 2,3-dioxygenase-like lactoylglutathione lyase family enzyme|tara:strand:- start:5989 stop:6447 length:459 start_codon:yes stop_codon:yes gene_type:complete